MLFCCAVTSILSQQFLHKMTHPPSSPEPPYLTDSSVTSQLLSRIYYHGLCRNQACSGWKWEHPIQHTSKLEFPLQKPPDSKHPAWQGWHCEQQWLHRWWLLETGWFSCSPVGHQPTGQWGDPSAWRGAFHEKMGSSFGRIQALCEQSGHGCPIASFVGCFQHNLLSYGGQKTKTLEVTVAGTSQHQLHLQFIANQEGPHFSSLRCLLSTVK